MPKKSTKAEFNTFVGGLITEASPLNFPPNASKDESNYQLNRNGTRERRLGFDLENEYSYLTVPNLETFSEECSSTYEWFNVSGDPSKNFLVVQFNNVLDIFNMSSENISGSGFISQIILSEFPASGLTVSFSSVDGNLVVAAGQSTIAVVEYNAEVFTVDYVYLKTRDLWGVSYPPADNDSLHQPVGYDQNHIYNLYNQTWAIPRRLFAENNTLYDAINNYYAFYNKFPANSESVWVGLSFQPNGTEPREVLKYPLFGDTFGANVAPSRGHFIVDVLRRGQSRSEAILNNFTKFPQTGFSSYSAKADLTPGGATTLCEFAGRVFYAGFSGEVVDGDSQSPNLANHIFFSQLVKNKNDISKCYQDGDPTSRESNDVIDTDGGYIRISGSEGIIRMVNIGTSLIVFGSNGVWAVSGGSDYGFTATNYKVDRLCEFGAIGVNAIVKDINSVFFWANDGIYNISKNQVGDLSAQNITQKAIQKLYDTIPNVSKIGVRGIYDSIGKTVRWVYSDTGLFTEDGFQNELILDLTLGAFYLYKIFNLGNTRVISPFKSPPFKLGVSVDLVYDDVDQVFYGAEAVTNEGFARADSFREVRYLVIANVSGSFKYTFAHYKDTRFRDWASVDGLGLDAEAFLVTGEVIAGDSSVAKQAPYLVVHFYRTEKGTDPFLNPLTPSGCLLRSQWDWSNSRVSNRWSDDVQIYRLLNPHYQEGSEDFFGEGFEMISTKNKLRGRGKALAIRFQTQPYKDCRIVGWNLSLNGNSIT